MKALWTIYHGISYPRLITLNARDRWKQVRRETWLATPAFAVLAGVGGGVCVYLQGLDGPWGGCQSLHPGGGWHTRGIRLAHLDGDAHVDLVVTACFPHPHGCSGEIRVWAGQGDGTFAAPIRVGDEADALAVCDLNADGINDLAAGRGTLSAFLGDGTGNFIAGVPTALTLPVGGGVYPQAACADLNADGQQDLVAAAGQAREGLCATLGSGDGTFGEALCSEAPGTSDSHRLATGHLNDDGRLDAVVVPLNNSSLVPLLGNGNGTFRALPEVDTAGSPSFVALQDVDGDGHLDAIVAASNDAGVVVHWGEGNGRFAAPATWYGTWHEPRGVTRLADATGDGIPDLVLPCQGSFAIHVIPILPTGTLATDLRLRADGPAGPVLATDLDGDGDMDVLASSTDSSSLRVFLQEEHRFDFGGRRTYETANLPAAFAATHLDGDDIVDLLDLSTGEGTLGVRPGRELHGWSPGDRESYPVGGAPVDMVLTDLNGDDRPDVAAVARADDTLAVLLQDGEGGFLDAVPHAVGARPVAVAAGDLTGDGVPDLVTADHDANQVSFLAATGDGQLLAAQPYDACTAPSDVALGDVTGDGRLDVAVACPDDQAVAVRAWTGREGALFDVVAFPLVGFRPTHVLLRDVDRDGRIDLVAALADSMEVAVLYGRGDGTFEDEVHIPYPWAAQDLLLADLDGDGADELVVTIGTFVSVLRGNRIACPPGAEGEGEGEGEGG